MRLNQQHRPAFAVLPEDPPTVLGFTVEITGLILDSILRFLRALLTALGFGA